MLRRFLPSLIANTQLDGVELVVADNGFSQPARSPELTTASREGFWMPLTNGVSQTGAGRSHWLRRPRGGGLLWQPPQSTQVHTPLGSPKSSRRLICEADGPW